jgi:hypothetical protein
MAAMRFSGMARSYKKSMLYGLFENASLLAIWLTAPSIEALPLALSATPGSYQQPAQRAVAHSAYSNTGRALIACTGRLLW